ncbi:MAG: hypothetical protein KDH16_15695 [Rhodocyclaceae bacterium]|nr:hypothetical protein [Rhodocyclaceae bacterium]
MPRTRKTQDGRPAQPMREVPGQVYGASVQQQALAQTMPLPQQQGAPAVAAAPVPTAGAAGTPQPQPPLDFSQIIAAGAAMRDQTGLLHRPSMRPNEPLTAGLSRGPGPGPEILGARRGTPSGDLLRRLTQQTGDPMFARLADQAGA